MFKTAIMLALAAMLVIGITAGYAEEKATPVETPWFDLENCGMCKHLMAEEGLMDHMTWENYVVGTGMMSVTVVAPGWEEKYKEMSAAMDATGKKLMAGEQMYLCGFCQSFGMLFATGKVKWEEVETKAGYVSLMTSTDPETIKMIQTHAQRTIDEYKKMETEHEGHEH